jgi:hypothetical protein
MEQSLIDSSPLPGGKKSDFERIWLMWRYLRAGLSFVLFRVPWLLLPLTPILAFALWICASAISFLFVRDMEVVRGAVAVNSERKS